jgi:hypothetical protein
VRPEQQHLSHTLSLIDTMVQAVKCGQHSHERQWLFASTLSFWAASAHRSVFWRMTSLSRRSTSAARRAASRFTFSYCATCTPSGHVLWTPQLAVDWRQAGQSRGAWTLAEGSGCGQWMLLAMHSCHGIL